MTLTPWLAGMILILPLMLREWVKLRVWAAMVLGSVAARLIYDFTDLSGGNQFGVYLLIDVAVAVVILWPPVGLTQRSLGYLSWLMIIVKVAILVSHEVGVDLWSSMLYSQFMWVSTWTRFAILLAWGAEGIVELVVHRHRGRSRIRATKAHLPTDIPEAKS